MESIAPLPISEPRIDESNGFTYVSPVEGNPFAPFHRTNQVVPFEEC